MLLFVFSINSAFASDSTLVYNKLYTNKEVKKEVKDYKNFNKMVRKLKKSANKENIDLKNSILSEVKDLMKKEYEELNNRITNRAKKLTPLKRNSDTLIKGDIPEGYNPTIKGQFEPVNKSDVQKGKNETEVLLLYTKILNKENRILRQMDGIKEFMPTNKVTLMSEILDHLDHFKICLKEELQLMSKEKGKKLS